MSDFDKILKENVEAVFLSLAEKILGLSQCQSIPKASLWGGVPGILGVGMYFRLQIWGVRSSYLS